MISRSLLVVAPAAYPLGGLATWLDGLLPGLSERGWRVRLALPRGRTFDVGSYLRRHPWSPTTLFENPSGTAYGRRRVLRRLLREATEEAVIVVNQPDLYPAALAERMSGARVPKIVGTLHGLVPELFEDFRRFRPAMTAAVGTSRLACEALAEIAGLDRCRVFHAPYGTPILEAPEPPAPRATETLELLHAGRLDEAQKRVSDLPRILAALDRLGIPWRLSIAGSGPDELALRAALGGDRRVSLLGDVPVERLREEVFRPGRILLLTSAWETGPIVAWEAMERCVVLVTARYLGLRAEGALRDGENCRIFPTGRAEAAAGALATLASAPAELCRLADAGRRLVRERFSIEASLDGWSRAMDAVLETTPPAPIPPPEVPGAGRLERYVGAAGAEWLRFVVRRRARALHPGDEWPHTHGGGMTQETFFEELGRLDRPVES